MAAPSAKASVEFSDQIQIEDVGICESVQKNLRLAQLFAGTLQREAGKRRARVSSDVCGSDESRNARRRDSGIIRRVSF